MRINIIEKYLKNLKSQLKSFGINKKEAGEAINSIRERMYSLIYHWNDEPFRKGVLITCHEEACFYEPKTGSTDIRAFVTAAVRNSKLENFHAAAKGTTPGLSDENIKGITADAVEFFNKADFKALNRKLHKAPAADFYGSITKKYPAAWRALMELGRDFSGFSYYEPVKVPKYEFKNYKITGTKEINGKMFEIKNGIDPEISDLLYSKLHHIADRNEEKLFAYSFKHITRNFELLLQVLEFLLSRNICFFSPNYFIANGRVGKQEKLTRPPHDKKDMYDNAVSFLKGGS